LRRRRYPWLSSEDLAVLAELERIDPAMARQVEQMISRQAYGDARERAHTVNVDPEVLADQRRGRAAAPAAADGDPPTTTTTTTRSTMNPPDLSCIACGIDSPCTFHESNPAGTPAPVDDPTGGALGYDPVGHARESLARDFDLRPTNRVRVREAKAEPVRERSVARDMGLADDELTPVAQLRLRDRWDRLDREPATPAGAVDFVGSLGELAELARGLRG
jgi:hypothetical protein